MKKYILLLAIVVLSACNYSHDEKPEARIVSEHAQTMASLYSYYADEYRALTYQAFNIAKERIDNIRQEQPGNEKLAIVVDIDETLLDNSPHQALMIVSDSSYPYMWNEWCDLAKAKPVPGALEFLQYADEQGFNVFYVSNRKKKYVQKSSMKNLINLGFPQVTEEHFMLRMERTADNPNPSDKQARRDLIAGMDLEIVLLIGDNLGDFYTDEHSQPARAEQVKSFKDEFGYKFIILPNAMYGNWPGSIGISDGASMDSLLRNMRIVFD